MSTTFIAEVFLTLRVYVLAKKHKGVLACSGLIIAWQWAIAIYAMSQSSKGTDQPALLLSRRAEILALPPLPDADPYHVCIFISTLTVTPWVEAWLCLSLAFDGLAFLAILVFTLRMMSRQEYQFIRILRVIQRDGIAYFFVLFSSNLVWLLLLLHARPGLKFMHNQPAMVLSAVMINRITLNLKKASDNSRRRSANGSDAYAWSIKTFEQPLTSVSKHIDSQTLVEPDHWPVREDGQREVIEMQSLESQRNGKQTKRY
ncbi:hypothetical protein VNI00_019430 [Paramarasmius palmivorus]|uniref:Transmembrane protein n=1 Tax=Paramarasmius palmivorus TaxID=297713 RepID=A0AAW0ALW2_9AGAR